MGTMIMSMCGSRIEHDVSTAAEYDDEIQNAGWNPLVSLEHVVPYENHATMPAELATIDAEQFLKKMYGCFS